MVESKYRYVILAITTAGLAMMLANVLTLNFTILCMTEEKYRWENFTIHLNFDVFEKVDFDPPRPPSTEVTDMPTVRPPTIPDFEIPGFRSNVPGFNWQTFNFARANPDLFIRIMKKVIKEVSLRAAERTGEALDPRNIDFSKFRDGFNLTDYNPDVVVRIKEYILDKLRTGQKGIQWIETESRNVTTDWRKLNVTDMELTNITWNGEVNGRIRVVDEYADYYYTNAEQTALFASVALGSLIFILPVTRMIDRMGTHKAFTVVGIISAICTALIPIAASFGFWPFIIVRFIQGIGFAACFPVIGAVTSNWAKVSENGLFNGALTGFLQLGPVIAFLASGLFCHLDAWEMSYYVHSFLTLVIIGIFWFVFRDHPREHSKVSVPELTEIQLGKVVVDGRAKHNRNKVPYGQIYKNKVIWAIWIAALGNMFGVFLIMFCPIFIRKVCFKLFNSIAFFGMALFFILLAILASVETQIMSIIFVVIAATILGFNAAGFYKASTLVSRHYSHFVNAHLQFFASLALLLVPFIIYAIAPNNSASEWSTIFYIFAGTLIITNIIFIALGSGEPAAFTTSNLIPENDLVANNGEQMKPIIKDAHVPHVNA
uniref:Major facilitator superfamily (MFS) profile domain-containing protein n=1 Tax=Panagrolaimus sp. PS1159 TaxID=55785 RepID=A0AC35G3E8_9BILA